MTDEEYMKRIILEDKEAQEYFDMIDDCDEQQGDVI